MIRLVGIDVDGTLVGSSGSVAPAVWQAADHARAAGIRLVLCSGRPAFGVALDYARKLDADGWHVFQNGASVMNLITGDSRSSHLPEESLKPLIERARSTGDLLEVYADAEYVCESNSPWAQQHAALLGVPFEPRAYDALSAPAVRAQWVVAPETAAAVLQNVPEGLEVAQSSSPLMPDVRFVGLTRAGTSKGGAIRTIAAEYGVDLDDVMYVGDAGNDLPALTIVGHPVAMANASSDVQKVARHTVAHVDAGGLAQALQLALDS